MKEEMILTKICKRHGELSPKMIIVRKRKNPKNKDTLECRLCIRENSNRNYAKDRIINNLRKKTEALNNTKGMIISKIKNKIKHPNTPFKYLQERGKNHDYINRNIVIMKDCLTQLNKLNQRKLSHVKCKKQD